MKNIYLALLTLSICFTSLSQTRIFLPVSSLNINQSITESASVWLSDTEIIIFYVNEQKDTIFSTMSKDRGASWSEPSFVQEINLVLVFQEVLYLTALKTSSGRILLAWSIVSESMKLIFSDDKGESWSSQIIIPGSGNASFYLSLTQWTGGEICMSFYILDTRSYYKLSFDDGLTWNTNQNEFPIQVEYRVQDLTIISVNSNTLIGFYYKNLSGYQGIYYCISTDYGLSWTEPIVLVSDSPIKERPRVSKLDNGNIIVVYQRNFEINGTGYLNKDIVYKISSNNGSTWSEERKITKYIGQDYSHSLSTLQNKTFITFATERLSEIIPYQYKYSLFHGVIQESEDKLTPPKVFGTEIPNNLIDYEKKEFVYRATVFDDESVESVIIFPEDTSYVSELFDDGLHNDGEANDFIFANTLPINNPKYPRQYVSDVNKISLPLNNKGVLAAGYYSYDQNAQIVSDDNLGNASVSKQNIRLNIHPAGGRFDDIVFLFSGGFFLSGYVNGNLFANGVSSSTLVEDYLPGKVGSNPDDLKNMLYVVNKNDPPFSISWQRWKDAVLLGADFYDGDGDGIYNPVDKNGNGTWDLNEDMPPILGDEIIWCVYNDGIPADLRRYTVDPVGIEIQQTLFATDISELENVIFVKYKLINTGLVEDILDSVYFGVWEDADIGDPINDMVGCDTLLQSGFYYSNVSDYLYGDNPPSFFNPILQGPIIITNNNLDTAFNYYGELIGKDEFTGAKNLGLTSHHISFKSDPALGDPNNKYDIRNYNQGKTRQGDYIDPCSSPYFVVRGGVDCNKINPRFWASGDPVNDIGWICPHQQDFRNMGNTGPFQLEKDKPQEIIIAYVIGRGTDPLNSITDARVNVQRAIDEYKSNFASMTYVPPPAILVNDYVLHQNYPNPFNPNT
ncbi:MAG: sialidase family protein, partial [Ignavibacteriaceae bacterium]|nr:sialidase family protein [Ignavibacteriaceae bacterium]